MEKAKSIKKKKTGRIYWGIDVASGQCVHISTVNSGQACHCICVACKLPLEARKGPIRKHHFAHSSNYECLYAYEVSIYKAVEMILSEKKQLFLPEAVLRFNSYKNPETIRNKDLISIDNVEFKCEQFQYPPELIVTSNGRRLRIILEFGGYYAKPDEQTLARWAEENNTACLLLKLPKINQDDDYDCSFLEEQLTTDNDKKRWIYNRKVEETRKKFGDCAYYPEQYGGGYICYAHKGYYKGKYSARWDDCVECEYCFEIQPYCRCLAISGVAHVSDLSLAENVRMKHMRDIISLNEQELQAQKEKESSRYDAYKRKHEESTNRSEINPNYELGYNEIIDYFDANGTDPTYDSAGNRWCICTECGVVKHTALFTIYGGPKSMNKGLCSDCAKKR